MACERCPTGPREPTHSSSVEDVFLCLSLFLCIMCTRYSWDCKVYTVKDIRLYQSLTLPTVELFACVRVNVCVVKKLCAPLNRKRAWWNVSLLTLMYSIDIYLYGKTTTNGPMCVHLFRSLNKYNSWTWFTRFSFWIFFLQKISSSTEIHHKLNEYK